MQNREGFDSFMVHKNGTNQNQSTGLWTFLLEARTRLSDFCFRFFSFTMNLKRELPTSDGVRGADSASAVSGECDNRPGKQEASRSRREGQSGCCNRAAERMWSPSSLETPSVPRNDLHRNLRTCTPAAAPTPACTSLQAHLECMRRALGSRQKCTNNHPKQGRRGVEPTTGDSEGFINRK